MKKTLSVLLSMLMLAGVATGCNPSGGSDNKKVDTSKEVTLKWLYTGNNVVDRAAVDEAMNKYLKDKINAKLEMVWAGWGDFDDKVVLAINGGDPIDIYFTCSWTRNEYVSYAKKGAYARLDDPKNNLLERCAPDLFKSIPAVMADAALVEVQGQYGVYAIPTYKEIAQQYNWEINEDLMAKYGLTHDDIKGYYELGPILEKVKQGEGADFYPINSDMTVLERSASNFDIIDSKGLLTFQFDPVNPSKSAAKLLSKYESPDFAKFVAQQREYYLKGYINPEASNIDTMSKAWTDTQTSGKFLLGAIPYFPGIEITYTAQRGYNVGVKPISAGYISSTSARGAMNAISSASKNPERAMMLLNLVNTDAAFRTLITYGVEGVHYTKEGDRIKFTDKKQDYGVWAAGLGNLSLLPLTVDDPANLRELFDKFNNVESVPLLGFSFDTEPVKAEMAALSNVVDEFEYPLISGSVDPATELPKFIEKLKANGIDKVMTEANNQVKTFMDAKNK